MSSPDPVANPEELIDQLQQIKMDPEDENPEKDPEEDPEEDLEEEMNEQELNANSNARPVPNRFVFPMNSDSDSDSGDDEPPVFNLAPPKSMMDVIIPEEEHHLLDEPEFELQYFDDQEVHVFPMESQGNVYTLADLPIHGMKAGNLLLVASLAKPIYSMKFIDANPPPADAKTPYPAPDPFNLIPNELIPEQTEIHFAYLPSGADILAMDAFPRNKGQQDHIIGITLTKLQVNETGVPVPTGQYFNVYSDWMYQRRTSLESIAENCISLELEYIPYQLTHCAVPIRNPKVRDAIEYVFLVTGSDKRIHLYIEDRLSCVFVEVEVEKFLAEFDLEYASIPYFVKVEYLDLGNSRRLSVVGCECGMLEVAFVECNSRPQTVLKRWRGVFGESIVTSVNIFGPQFDILPMSIKAHFPDFYESSVYEEEYADDHSDIAPVQLLVTYAHSKAVVFKDVINKGLTQIQKVNKSNKYDVITCSIAADLDFDGNKELVIGTYGQKLLVFKEIDSEWQLALNRSLSHPVQCLRHLDLTGDGLKELVVMTTKAVHVFQHKAKDLRKLRAQRLTEAMKCKEKKETQI